MKILVVDDDANMLQMLRLQLQDHGFIVEEASDGRQALERLAEQQFDVILSDLEMPHLNGCRLRQAAQDAGYPGAWILMTGSFDDPRLAQECGPVLWKPFRLQDLLAHIRAASLRSLNAVP